jgi:hypothetical protein
MGEDRATASGPRRRLNHAVVTWATPLRFGLTALSLFGGALVFWFAVDLFPYHSINHDEGVYLQQAAMLLEGKLSLTPPVPDAVRPWFFVREGPRLYPKYGPVPAALFAAGVAVGLPRLALAAIAAGIVALTGLLARAAFDRRVGLLAAALLLTAPLYLVTTAVFLPYAPTTLLNLLFAYGYVRALRDGRRRYALLSGGAVALAFFARPYTAALFALPFIGHALAVCWREWRTIDPGATGDGGPLVSRPVSQLLVVAALGSLGVCVTLAYNALVTGDPFLFPYAAFAPEDGPGFGHREILNHEETYTPELAVRSNARVVWHLATTWGPLGAVGTALATLGVLAGLRESASADRDETASHDPLPDRTLRLVLASLFATVVVGNVYFWGNFNILAGLEDPTDGLIAYLGPFYHFDLLLPLATFAAAGIVASVDRLRAVFDARAPGEWGRVAVLVVLLVSTGAVAGVHGSTVDSIVERNAEYTDDVAPVYQPFEDRAFDDAVVFMPTPYGDWLAHPFQYLRNDPSLSGDRVFVLDRDTASDFAALDAFPERQPYRFTYRGDWPPPEDEQVEPFVQSLEVHRGDTVRVTSRMGVVVGAQSATVRIAADGEAVQYGVERLDGETVTVQWLVTPDGARVTGDALHRYSDDDSVPIDGPTDVTLSVTFTQPGGATITYVEELSVAPENGTVRGIWPPERRVCRLTADCGREGTYVEGEDYASGVSLSSNATVENRSG